MKKLLRLILPFVMALAVIPAVQAQDNKSNRREMFTEAQAKKIAEELKLDESTTKQFVTTFTRCQEEIWASGPHKERPQKENKSSMTDDEARQIIKERFAHRQKINEIQEKYYTEYSKFLTQRQILQFYNIEKKMMDKFFRQRMDGRRGNNAKGNGKRKGAPRCEAPAQGPGACAPCI